jgi:hypothetical protein
MTFGLDPGKLGFKLGEVLVGLQSGTTDTPETLSSTQNKLHTLKYVWNPDTLSYEVATTNAPAPALYALELDEASATVTYVGEAEAGSATSGAVWRVKRITTTGADLSIKWADGDTLFDNVWDNRASLSY